MIDRRVREHNVESELLPLETPASVLLQQGFKAIIISGGKGLFSPIVVKTIFDPKDELLVFIILICICVWFCC